MGFFRVVICPVSAPKHRFHVRFLTQYNDASCIHARVSSTGAGARSNAAIPKADRGGGGHESGQRESCDASPRSYFFRQRGRSLRRTSKAKRRLLSIGCWHSKVAFIWPHVLA